MAKLKVYGGEIFYKTGNRRAVIATTSQREVSRVTKLSLSHVQRWFCETGNKYELKTALEEPGVLFIANSNSWAPDGYFKADMDCV